MHHHVIVVHEDPESVLETFHPQGLDSGLTQGLFQVLGQGEHMASGSAGTDEEIIGKGTEPLHIQDNGVQALDGVNGLDRQFQQVFRSQGFRGDRGDGLLYRYKLFLIIYLRTRSGKR